MFDMNLTGAEKHSSPVVPANRQSLQMPEGDRDRLKGQGVLGFDRAVFLEFETDRPAVDLAQPIKIKRLCEVSIPS